MFKSDTLSILTLSHLQRTRECHLNGPAASGTHCPERRGATH